MTFLINWWLEEAPSGLRRLEAVAAPAPSYVLRPALSSAPQLVASELPNRRGPRRSRRSLLELSFSSLPYVTGFVPGMPREPKEQGRPLAREGFSRCQFMA